MNRATILGRLGQDPELRHTQSGKAVTTLSVATSEKRGDKEETEWHSVICWEKTAENCAKYLKKGQPVLVEGRIQTRSWEDKGVKRFKTEIVASNVQFIGGGERKDAARVGKEQPSEASLDEIPF